eukprot:363568-Chlamydomonas_euryale.AAC.1
MDDIAFILKTGGECIVRVRAIHETWLKWAKHVYIIGGETQHGIGIAWRCMALHGICSEAQHGSTICTAMHTLHGVASISRSAVRRSMALALHDVAW